MRAALHSDALRPEPRPSELAGPAPPRRTRHPPRVKTRRRVGVLLALSYIGFVSLGLPDGLARRRLAVDPRTIPPRTRRARSAARRDHRRATSSRASRVAACSRRMNLGALLAASCAATGDQPARLRVRARVVRDGRLRPLRRPRRRRDRRRAQYLRRHQPQPAHAQLAARLLRHRRRERSGADDGGADEGRPVATRLLDASRRTDRARALLLRDAQALWPTVAGDAHAATRESAPHRIESHDARATRGVARHRSVLPLRRARAVGGRLGVLLPHRSARVSRWPRPAPG